MSDPVVGRRVQRSGPLWHDRRVAQRIGLTGGIGSGKSTVADLLAARGAVIVDADVLAREVVGPGTPGLASIVERFGRGVLTPDGALDRAALGGIVFSDASARADLNAIVHPAVRARASELRAEALASDPDAVVVEVIPLLVETGQADAFDVVIVVDCPVEVQVRRVMQRSGLSRDEALARVRSQADRAERLAHADMVVDNSGDRGDLLKQVDAAWGHLQPAGEVQGCDPLG